MSGKKGMKATGRPRVADPRVNITIRVAPETAQRIRGLRDNGFRAGRWLDGLIADLYYCEFDAVLDEQILNLPIAPSYQHLRGFAAVFYRLGKMHR